MQKMQYRAHNFSVCVIFSFMAAINLLDVVVPFFIRWISYRGMKFDSRWSHSPGAETQGGTLQ